MKHGIFVYKAGVGYLSTHWYNMRHSVRKSTSRSAHDNSQRDVLCQDQRSLGYGSAAARLHSGGCGGMWRNVKICPRAWQLVCTSCIGCPGLGAFFCVRIYVTDYSSWKLAHF